VINKTVAGFADNLQMQVPGGSLQGTKATFQQLARRCSFMLLSMLFGISDDLYGANRCCMIFCGTLCQIS